MIRIASIIAILLLAVAVYGRYQTETVVKQREDDIGLLIAMIDDAEDDIRTLRAEIAHLETPQRLSGAALAHDATLRPATPSQIVSAEEAASRFLQAKDDENLLAQADDPMAAFLEDYVVRAAAQEGWEPQ